MPSVVCRMRLTFPCPWAFNSCFYLSASHDAVNNVLPMKRVYYFRTKNARGKSFNYRSSELPLSPGGRFELFITDHASYHTPGRFLGGCMVTALEHYLFLKRKILIRCWITCHSIDRSRSPETAPMLLRGLPQSPVQSHRDRGGCRKLRGNRT